MVSIIIPVYNVEKYLMKCLDSVINQTYSDWEAILVDDGSSDGSPAICDEYAKKDSRFKVVHQANGGASKARNAGLDEAKGDLVIFIDSDDWVEPNHLSNFLFPGWEQYDAVFCQWQQDFPDHVVRNQTKYFPYEGKNFFYDVVSLKNKYLFILTINQYYKREILSKYHIRFREDLKVCEDSLFTYEYFAHASNYMILPTVSYHYIMSDDPGHLTNSKITVTEMFKIASIVRKESKKICNEDFWNVYIDAWFFDRMDSSYKINIFRRPFRKIMSSIGGRREVLCTYKSLKNKILSNRKGSHRYYYYFCKIIYCIPSPLWVLVWHCFFAGIDGLKRKLIKHI